ncbi:MAG: ASKHA domain-containing protein [Armatimonadota bacterium]|nr:ASKHA domain-containing protein [Armatimonadota bacterium]MCX7777586.1 ASKHA domain-containing protein [Armatimonadota bacterium]MDW8025595.1 ASKHA domain-containing protein [Armatimonadota bacterium]
MRNMREGNSKGNNGLEINRRFDSAAASGTNCGSAKKSTVAVYFDPHRMKVDVPCGMTALEAARCVGINIETPCGGIGVCGKCKVRFTSGAPKPTEQERALLSDSEIALGYRLACRSRIFFDAVVFVPEELWHPSGRILIAGVAKEISVKPLIQKRFVKVPEPSLYDERGDWERLTEALWDDEAVCPLDELSADIGLLRALPRTLREAQFEVTVVTAGSRMLAVENSDTTRMTYGMAFDIGTTTVVCYLADLRNGITLATASAINPQVAYGDDIISRIAFASERDDGLKLLNEAIVSTVNELALRACSEAGVATEHVYHATFVGNTCMLHLLLGLDVTQLGRAPYVAVVQSMVELRACELGITAIPNAVLHVLPCIGGFVGADAVAMILLHLFEDIDAALAIDIGTNTEVVVKHGDRVLAASAAAGPAFEGARIKHGMRAADGAIYSVKVGSDDLHCMVIGDVPARGICGTGLIDAVAALLELGIIDESGRMRRRSELHFLPSPIANRLVERDNDVEFVLSYGDEAKGNPTIVLTQRDIRQLQLAKASIRAAIETLLKLVGITCDVLQAVYIAGAFGTFIPKESAMRIGLLPPISLERIHSVGNAAGIGAKLALINEDELKRAELIARSVRHVELGTNPTYAEAFFEWMRF